MVYNNQIMGFTAPVTDAVVPWMPYISTPRLLTRGNPRGHYMTSPRETFYWGPLEQKEEHLTERPSYLLVGDVGASKSAFPKIAIFEDCAVANDGHPGRAFGINMREIAGKDEYGMLALYMGADVSNLTRRFNIFSDNMGFSLSDHLVTAVRVYEASNDDKSPERHMKLAMRVALAEMFAKGGWRGKRPGIGTYISILLSISKSEALEHIKRMLEDRLDDDFDLETEAEVGVTTPEEVQEDTFDITNIDWDEFIQDAGAVATSALNFKTGEFGDIVGGDEPLDMDTAKRFFGLNIAHLTEEKVKAFAVEFIMRLMSSGDPRYKFDQEMWDEGHGLWNYRGFSYTFPKKLKYKRGDASVLYHATQDLRDFEATKFSKLALNSIKDYGAVIFAKLSSPDSVAFAAEHIDLTPFEQRVIQGLNPGQYGIKFPNEPVQFVQVDLNPIRRHLIETNIAVIEALKKRHAYALGR